MTAKLPPVQTLEDLGWEVKASCNGDIMYHKYGTYGWFSAEAAWKHQKEVLDRGRPQYPTELMPPFALGQRLKEKAGGSQKA